MNLEINRPDVVAEVTDIFEAYERALCGADATTLHTAFWDSELTVRFGVDEELYGIGQITQWRTAMPALPSTRVHGPTTVATFGDDFATVSTEFDNGDGSAPGRQSQTWVRGSEGWRIVAAHVSLALRHVGGL